jgi:hypothetical protein
MDSSTTACAITGCELPGAHTLLIFALIETQSERRVWCRQNNTHSTPCRGKQDARAAKASRGEEPLSGRYASACHVHAALPRRLGTPLLRDAVGHVGESRQKRRLAALGMRKALSGSGSHGVKLRVEGLAPRRSDRPQLRRVLDERVA